MTKNEALQLSHNQTIYHRWHHTPSGSPTTAAIVGNAVSWERTARLGKDLFVLDNRNIGEWIMERPAT